MMAVARCILIISLCSVSEAVGSNDYCPPSSCTKIKLNKIDKVVEKAYFNDGKSFCLNPLNPLSLKGLRHIWCYYHVFIINSTSEEVTLILGNSSSSVSDKNRETSIWGTSNVKEIETFTSPYEIYCIGVKSFNGKSGKAFINFEKTSIQKRFPVVLLLGISLFLIAPYLTKNTTFYYSSGIFIGIVGSLLILVYFFGKFVPKKHWLGLGILAGGYSIAGYVVHWTVSQGIEFVLKHWLYLLVYVAVAGLASFAVLYRMGPANPRTIHLIQWFLQLIGLILVFISFYQLTSVAVSAVIMLLSWYNMPLWMSYKLRSLFSRLCCCLKPLFYLFKKQRRMLTLEEFEEQGRIETEKALKSLKKSCRNSSEFWEHDLNKLQKQRRFLDFLSGKDHVTEIERNEHESEYASTYYDTSSSSDVSDDEHSSQTSSPHLSHNSSFTSNYSFSPSYY